MKRKKILIWTEKSLKKDTKRSRKEKDKNIYIYIYKMKRKEKRKKIEKRRKYM